MEEVKVSWLRQDRRGKSIQAEGAAWGRALGSGEMLKGLPLVQRVWVEEKRLGGRWVKELVFEPVAEERA